MESNNTKEEVKKGEEEEIVIPSGPTKEEAEEDAVENKAFAELGDVDKSKIVDYLFKGSKETWEQATEDYGTKPEHIKKLIENLIDNGFKKPSYIQTQTIPFLALATAKPGANGENEDMNVGLLAQSQNGTGKTLAYVIPSILSVDFTKKLKKNQKTFLPQVIIMTPNTILVKQIKKDFELLTKGIGDNILVGTKFENKKIKYEEGYIFIGTAGHIETAEADGAISFDETKLIVIDEADMVIGMSLSSLDNVLDNAIRLQKKLSICFISATYTDESKKYIEKIFVTKKYGDLIQRTIIPADLLNLQKVVQYRLKCDKYANDKYNKNSESKDKLTFISKIIGAIDTQYIIFLNGKKFAATVEKVLKANKISVSLLTGDVKGRDRVKALEDFRSKKTKALVTTNILARGFDERNIGVVINYDVPTLYGNNFTKPDIENYIHRVGRTGRFGDSGIAINLTVSKEDDDKLDEIAKHYGVNMPGLKFDIDDITETIKAEVAKIKKINEEKRDELGEKIGKMTI